MSSGAGARRFPFIIRRLGFRAKITASTQESRPAEAACAAGGRIRAGPVVVKAPAGRRAGPPSRQGRQGGAKNADCRLQIEDRRSLVSSWRLGGPARVRTVARGML